MSARKIPWDRCQAGDAKASLVSFRIMSTNPRVSRLFAWFPFAMLLWTAHLLPAGARAAQEDTMETRCRREIVELHQFFEDWFNAALAPTDESFGRFASVIADDFVMVTPGGSLVERAPLVAGLRASHGRWRGQEPVGRIWIENVRVHRILEGGDLAIATYEEWQEIAGEEIRGRLSTVVLRVKEWAPNGLEWLHVHETWLSD